MADPVVHLTNGLPDSGTGNITTLGQTLLDGANATHGVTTGAAVTTDVAGTFQQYLRGLVKLWAAGTLGVVLGAETTKVIGVARTADGSGNLLTSTGNALDVNIKTGTNANGSAVSASSAPVVIASDQAAVAVKGSAASGATASGNPVPAAGLAVSSETAVTNGQAAALITDLARKLIVMPYANPENFVSGAITSAMTGTTTTSLVAAPAAGLRNYITTIICSNAHATVGTDIIIQDGSGGTTLLTIPAAAVYGGAVITLPTPLRQPTTATALFCANVTTGASTKVSAVGYKGA